MQLCTYNAAYMVIYFIGGSLGLLIGAEAWGLAGWPAVCAAGIVFASLALLFLWIQRKNLQEAERNGVKLIVHGHDPEQWPKLKHAPR